MRCRQGLTCAKDNEKGIFIATKIAETTCRLSFNMKRNKNHNYRTLVGSSQSQAQPFSTPLFSVRREFHYQIKPIVLISNLFNSNVPLLINLPLPTSFPAQFCCRIPTPPKRWASPSWAHRGGLGYFSSYHTRLCKPKRWKFGSLFSRYFHCCKNPSLYRWGKSQEKTLALNVMEVLVHGPDHSH